MVFEKGVHLSPRSRHLNKPLPFCTSTCLTSLAFVAAGSRNCIVVTVFGKSARTVWTLESPKGPGLESWHANLRSGTVGTSQQLPRALPGEFPCTPPQGVSCLKSLAGKRKRVSGEQRDSKTNWTQHAHQGSSIPAAWALCHFGLVRTICNPGWWAVPATWMPCHLGVAPLGLHTTWTLCHLGLVRTACGIGWQGIRC